MELKSIIQGRLEFANEKSYAQMLRMYQSRVETYYKYDVFIKEDAFDEPTFSINIPRLITIGQQKTWTNTVKLLEYLAQYALSGSISAWLVQEGNILEYVAIEPKGDKAIVKKFMKGRKLSAQTGKEKEALTALSEVIEQHDRHAMAYERRGYVNYALGRMTDALYDFNKCISYDPGIPSAYYCRAKVHIRKGNLEEAIRDLVLTTQKAIALQPIYWKARKLKGRCHYDLKQYADAAREFKLFLSRKFTKDDPNFSEYRHAAYLYAQTLLALGEHDKASDALHSAEKFTGQDQSVTDEMIETLRAEINEVRGEPVTS